MAIVCRYLTSHGQQLDAAYVKAGFISVRPLTKIDTETGVESNHFVLSAQLDIFANAQAKADKRPPIDQVSMAIVCDTEKDIHTQVYNAARAMRRTHMEGEGDARRTIDDGPFFVASVDG